MNPTSPSDTLAAPARPLPRDQMDHEDLIVIEDLGIAFAGTDSNIKVIDGLSLRIKRGEILGVAGESGCGKSTLVKAILRILPPPAFFNHGHIWYQGQDILELSVEAMQDFRWRQAAMVFQNALSALNPVLRIREQLIDTILAHDKCSEASATQKAKEYLSIVGIDPARIDSYPHELSGGMRQRVMIAMALLLEAPLLILDEPTTALDVVMQREILNQIVELQKRFQLTVVFVTHDLPMMLAYCDRIAILYSGRVVEIAGAKEFSENARHPYTRGLLSSFPPLTGPKVTLTGIPGNPPSFSNPPTGCRFHPRCPLAQEICSREEPLLTNRQPGHRAACHFS